MIVADSSKGGISQEGSDAQTCSPSDDEHPHRDPPEHRYENVCRAQG
jgi:hypothetical protein